MSRSASGSSGSSSRAVPPRTAPDTRLYVTTLRLLDLDLRPDWPAITVQTFSARNADQKQRIGAVEWSLFRLFELWDPHETSQKLQPFFPPLEPLQSLNLRAALYRCLNDLKKNGVLGRESVLRKTMLDECKGDKFFEMLAVFSMQVLKKTLSAQRGPRDDVAVARRLATATALSRDQQATLMPLAIAHKAALVNVLKRKNEKRQRFSDFQTLLQEKADGMRQKIRQCKATPRTQKHAIPEKDAAAIKKQLTANWIGDQRWLEALLYGDGIQVQDAFLGLRFDDVLSMVEQGQKPEDALPQTGLLESLQLRVLEQQSRLQKWKKFHETLGQDAPSRSSQDRPTQAPIKDFNFGQHLNMQLASSKPSSATEKAPLRTDYHGILTDMDAELLSASQAVHQRTTMLHLPRQSSPVRPSSAAMEPKHSKADLMRKHSSQNIKEKPLGLPSRLKKATVETGVSRAQRPVPEATATPLESEATLVGPSSVADGSSEAVPEVTVVAPCRPAQSPSPSAQRTSNWPSEPPILQPPPFRAEDALAEQIISSIGDATPSPVKKQPRLSLVERTQQSLGHMPSFEPTHESPPHSSPQLPELPSDFRPRLDRQASLLERTRQSMAAMSLQPPASQAKRDSRKSRSRESLFPVNQFDTPRSRKSLQAVEDGRSGESTPKEILFSDDIDYEHVFKSRPRVAHSPIFSPAEQDRSSNGSRDMNRLDLEAYRDDDSDDFDEGVTGVDLADVDADDYTQAWDNSPSRRAGGGPKPVGRLFG